MRRGQADASGRREAAVRAKSEAKREKRELRRQAKREGLPYDRALQSWAQKREERA